MFTKMRTWLLRLLGFGLPVHGALTVLAPEWFRWWKEIILLGLLGLLLLSFRTLWLAFQSQYHRTAPLTYVGLLLGWVSWLVLMSSDTSTALVAARYLTLGWIVFGIFWGLSVCFDPKKVFHNFSTGLISGSVVSVLFGIWAQWLGGFAVLSHWYSATISSWVPGQTLPLYHQTSEGVIRMQGMASGPIEFSHLLVLALWLVLFQGDRVSRWGLGGLFLLGIWWSGSRAALLAALILLGFQLVVYLKQKWSLKPRRWAVLSDHWQINLCCILLMAVAGLGGLKYVVQELPETQIQKLVRVSDSDHITRPIEAFKMGLENPIQGNLGALGPAARAHNLATQNNDKAPIAENVLVDYFAQLGVVGLFLSLAFWGTWFWQVRRQSYLVLLGGVSLLLMSLATIFDMTPISIAWFAILALATMLPQKE